MADPLYKINPFEQNYAAAVATYGKSIILRVLEVKCEKCYIKSIIAKCANENKYQKRRAQHNTLMDLALLTVLTYQIYVILMDLGLLTVLTKLICTRYN
jgi:hypothetical protein